MARHSTSANDGATGRGCRRRRGATPARAAHRLGRGDQRARPGRHARATGPHRVPAAHPLDRIAGRRLQRGRDARSAGRRGRVIVDANILLYAVDSSSPQHERARAWLEDALNGYGRVGLPWSSLTAFLRVAPHPRVSAHPLGRDDAWGFVEEWLAAGPAWIPVPTDRHGEVLGRLLAEGD